MADAVRRLGLKELVDLATMISHASKPETRTVGNSPFIQGAAISLAGGRDECTEVDCRVTRAGQFAQYALMLCDSAYVYSPFGEYEPNEWHQPWDDDDFTRDMFLGDLTVLCELRPLIEAGIVVPFSPPPDVCPQCLAQNQFGKDADRRFEAAGKALRKELNNRVSMTIMRLGPELGLTFDGPESIVPHGGGGLVLQSLPPEIRRMPRVMARLRRGEGYRVPLSLRQRLPFARHLAARVIQSVVYGLTVADSLRGSYVTDSEAHVRFLNAFGADPAAVRRNKLAHTHLASAIPFLPDVEIPSLLRLRTDEPESFLLYRRALGNAMQEFKDERPSDLSAARAKDLYGDVIQPELARLDRRLQEARRGAVSAAVRSGLGWAAVLSFGLYTGIVPTELAAAAKALGLTKVAADILTQGAVAIDAEREIRQESFYFLWQVRKLARAELRRRS